MVAVSLDTLLTQTVTIIVPGITIDTYENPVLDWPGATRTDVLGRLEQASSVEVTLQRDTVVSDWLLFLHPDVSINPLDRVEADGRVFEVVGAPAPAQAPWGVHHLEVRLRYLEG